MPEEVQAVSSSGGNRTRHHHRPSQSGSVPRQRYSAERPQFLQSDRALANDMQQHNSHITARYRPGDAAKRNEDKRRSLAMVEPQSKIVAVEQQLGACGPIYHRECALDFGDRPDNAEPVDTAEDESTPTRPPLRPHDRPDWSQRSQYGDDVKEGFLHAHWERRSRRGKGEEEHDRSDSAMRPGSAVAEDMLGDLVDFKKREGTWKGGKVRRRQSIVAFFRRT
jgi:hypothetical protein